MKIGIHLSSFTPSWNDDIIPFIKASADIGYEAVEIPLMDPDSFDYQKVASELRFHALCCTCGTSVTILEDPSSNDSEIQKAGIRRLKKCIDICNYLETDCLGGVLYAPWGQHKRRIGAASNREKAIESFGEVSEYARQKGVLLSLEILNRYESYFMNTIDEGIEFLDQLNQPNVKLHFDTFHAHIEEKSIADAILKGGQHIAHVHLCDNNRAAPGTGMIDFTKVRDALRQIGFDRYVMVENFVIPDSEAGEQVCIWRKTAESPFHNAQLAYQFVSTCFNS